MIWGVKPTIFGNPHIYSYILLILQSAALSVVKFEKMTPWKVAGVLKPLERCTALLSAQKWFPQRFQIQIAPQGEDRESGMVKSSPKKTTQKVEENRDATGPKKNPL